MGDISPTDISEEVLAISSFIVLSSEKVRPSWLCCAWVIVCCRGRSRDDGVRKAASSVFSAPKAFSGKVVVVRESSDAPPTSLMVSKE